MNPTAIAATLFTLGSIAQLSHAQVQVNEGEVFLPSDFLAGTFMGQEFTPGLGTVFSINSGGIIGEPEILSAFHFEQSTVNLNSGAIAKSMSRYTGVNLNIFEGAIVESNQQVFLLLTPFARSTVTMSGGIIGDNFDLFWGNMNLSGGQIGNDARFSHGTVHMAGGIIGDNLEISFVTLIQTGGHIHSLRTTGGSPSDPVNLLGGSVGILFGADSPDIRLSGSTVGSVLLDNDSHLTITGGTVLSSVSLAGLSASGHMSAGSIGSSQQNDPFSIHRFSSFAVSGGMVYSPTELLDNSRLEISGGVFDSSIRVTGESTLSLLVREVSIDRSPIDLSSGMPIEIEQRGNALLEAVLADGTPFQLLLRGENDPIPSASGSDTDFISGNATLTVALAFESCPGDCDFNGSVDFNDLVTMLFEFGPSASAACDADASGIVDFNDLVAALFLFGPCE